VPFPQSAFLSYRYWLVVVLFALGLMAKPMLVTLPFVLLLCDYWPLARWNRMRDLFQLILEKLPLFALSAASSVLTFYAQRSGGAVESINGLGIGARLSNTVVSYSKYILMFFYPAHLAVLYPLDSNIPPLQLIASILLLASITIVCLWQLGRRPFLIVGWLWFLGTLVPVIGIVQVGSQALADRYTYVPYFGLFIMIVWSVASLVDGNRVATHAALTAAAISVLVFAGFAWRQTSYWRDNETLYRHALAVTSRNGPIAQNLCHHFMLNGRLEEAEPLCRDAIAITPENPELFNTNGVLLMKLDRFPEAADSFKISIKYSPRYILAWLNLAQAQALSGQPEDAENSLRSAMEINNGQANDGFAPALSDLAAAYGQQGNYDKAADNYRQLLSLRPNDSAVHASFAKILFFQRKLEDAQQEAQNALQLEPKSAEGWNVLGLVALEKKQNKDAANYFSKALEINSDFPEAKQNLSRVQNAS
jgi:tetratricopeptide (TPR) repeat protein